MKIRMIVAGGLCIVATSLYAQDQGEMSIMAHSSVQQKPQTRMLEKQYKDKLDAIRRDITMLKDSIMLVNPEVHAPKLQAIETKFHALNRELEEKELLRRLSKRFSQELAAVEREILDTRELFGKSGNISEIID